MLYAIAMRLLGLPFMLLALVTAAFLLVRIIPGDPALLMAGADATPEQVAALTVRLGLDKSIITQYFTYLGNVLTGDMGISLRSGQSALGWALDAVRYSATLAVISMLIAILGGVVLGVLAALKRGTALDTLIVIISLAGVSVPAYLSAMLLILVFGVWMKMVPIAGATTPLHFVLPSLSVGLIMAGQLARITRSAMLEVLSQDYIRTAKAKGVSQHIRIFKHGLRNAGIPILSVAGEQFGSLFGAAVITETIFAIPGLGRLLIEAINWRDYALIQACIVVFGALIILINLATDIAYAVVDPRLRN